MKPFTYSSSSLLLIINLSSSTACLGSDNITFLILSSPCFLEEIPTAAASDPIYDVYEDDVRVVDFVFYEDSFENFVCAKIGQDEIRAKFGRDKIRAKPMQDEFRENFGESQKIRFYENFGFEDKSFEDFSHEKPIQDSRTNLLQPGDNDADKYL
ncbi:hypothetical protein F2Q68_00045551 [Brassica cretica]|uniref:Cathepsin propeptide inhibitor domain-containing protein n=2 Tax=Brassica cretica TaxID=69181 RepID=A0ABQ7B1K2_BRACR|nr:hypothetical protein F2Q68_00045551 [Brassica cretica]KAF3520545.1 hypothetical protein DY000_02062475 [Brassica cretica]